MGEDPPPPQAMEWRSPYPSRAGLEEAMEAAARLPGRPVPSARTREDPGYEPIWR